MHVIHRAEFHSRLVSITKSAQDIIFVLVDLNAGKKQ